jgi:ABC-type phosphate transport system substrate-binding protein
MNTLMNMRTPLAVCAVVLGLVACGDGSSLHSGGNNPPTATTDPLVPGTDVPTSATTSAAGATAFVKMVVASSAETAEPLQLGEVVLATTDTEEPDASI